MKTRTIQLAGYTNKNTAVLFFDGKIYECTSYDAADFDYGDDAEKALEECKAYIKRKEEEEGWIPGAVTCWIDEFEFDEETED